MTSDRLKELLDKPASDLTTEEVAELQELVKAELELKEGTEEKGTEQTE